MKTALLSMAIVSAFSWTDAAGAAGGEDRERGLRLYQEGKFAEAQQAFAAALAEQPESGELQWNLALAAWRAGDLATAEVAAEKYAAQAKDAKVELHRGLLGAIRFAETEQLEQAAQQALSASQSAAGPAALGDDPATEPADPLELLQQALAKAKQAKSHFVRGARANATPELVRNTERSLAKIRELKRLIEELEKQREDQQQEEGDKNPDDKKPEDGDEESEEEKGADAEEEESTKEESPEQESPEEEATQEESKEEQSREEEPSEQESEQPKPDEKPPESKPEESKQQESKPQEGQGTPEQPEPQPQPESQKPEQEGASAGEEGSEGQEPGEQGDPSPQAEGNGESGKQGERTDGQPPESDPTDPESGTSSDPADTQNPPEPNPTAQRSDAPGEGGRGQELSPEQAQRLLERLKKLDEKFRKARARRSNRRRVVERDW